MASANSQLANPSRQHLRPLRIPDSEWESQRERLLELYLEQDVSRDEIVHTMAREHNFHITWDIRYL